MHSHRISALTKNLLLILFLFIAVLLADYPILKNDILYPEQPTMYLVNQMIHSISDLINVYLHPQALDDVIPFFRPSGHFLLYQLITPIIGWHNTRALIVLNLFFLALSGFVMIKLYGLFFPGKKIGGYLAFGFYLMHPALILSRFLLLHFEFSYVFFLLSSLYCFILFCQKNKMTRSMQHMAWLVGALCLYFIAITFKEVAIMLGPVMLVYFVIHFYHDIFHKDAFKVMALLSAATVAFAIYLTLPWPMLAHPQQQTVLGNWSDKIILLNQFLNDVTGMRLNWLTQTEIPYLNGSVWRHIIFPPAALIITSLFLLIGLSHAGWMFIRPQNKTTQQSIFFLFVTIVLFLVIPCLWTTGFPWHWNLSILFLSFILGFGIETALEKIRWHARLAPYVAALLFCVLLGTAADVNAININEILHAYPIMNVTREAVFHPPAIQQQLTAESVIVIATGTQSDYDLGNSHFNFLASGTTFQDVNPTFAWPYRRFDDWRYNGTLFKWAYLMPNLHEELFPFSLAKMQQVPGLEIYQWLENYNHIFCFTVDDHWHNVTELFRKNLLREKQRRHLVFYSYDIHYAQKIAGHVMYSKKIPFPDARFCRYECDQDITCKGFLYVSDTSTRKPWISCDFFNSITPGAGNFCSLCQSFVKGSSLS